MFFKPPQISVLRFDGTIGAMSVFINSLRYVDLEDMIEDAFDGANTRAVFLSVNCPGGSPTQAHLMYSRIRQLSEETGVPVYAFVEDTAASAGYWLACAADMIFAQPTSIVGSIGIVTSSFGFENVMEKVGVKRRVFATGGGKNRLDPFLPENDDDAAWLDDMQKEMCSVFADVVKSRRQKLQISDERLLSGDSWVGEKLIAHGLIDGFSSAQKFMADHQEFAKCRLKAMEKSEGLTSRLVKMFI